MAKLIEMDEWITFTKQMEEDVGSQAILINKFTTNPEDIDRFLKAWTADATIFKQQSGYISAQLHRGYCWQRNFHQLCTLGVYGNVQESC